VITGTARWLDSQLGLARLIRHDFLRKVFPDHWSFMLGEVALYAFVVLLLTGVYLTLFFRASPELVIYDGSYEPLQGAEVSSAYASALHISFDVRAGLLVRQIHHWSALVFVAAIMYHLCRVFFTGAFRRPRQLNWMIGVSLLVLATGAGFTGYSVVDDLLSGTGLVIGYSVMLSIPVIGPWLAFLALGGPVPNEQMIPRLYAAHVMILPALIGVLLAAHLTILWRQKHTNFPGPQRSNESIVGTRLWPVYATKAGGFFLIVVGVLVALGAFVQINPIWVYGPYIPSAVTAGSQPDWYFGWLEGALRLFPAWEPSVFGYPIPSPFVPGVVLPTFMLMALYLYPFIEEWFTNDREVHHVLEHPSDRPMRTAVGAYAIAFFIIMLVTGSNDIIAARWRADVGVVRDWLRVIAIVVPIVVGVATYYVCRWRATIRATRSAESATA
jgi:ubiquinol-cytochrome c reductase cytochrome b subunit